MAKMLIAIMLTGYGGQISCCSNNVIHLRGIAGLCWCHICFLFRYIGVGNSHRRWCGYGVSRYRSVYDLGTLNLHRIAPLNKLGYRTGSIWAKQET